MQSVKLHTLERRVKASQNSIRNHLLSILSDASHVNELKSFMSHFSLFANLRNGAWYAEEYSGLCYFKSTDGHDGNWNFSTSRLNLDVANAATNGIIIVDSTRRGKVFPDSMKATIPIWCAVINSVLFSVDHFTPAPWMHITQIKQIKQKILLLTTSLPTEVKTMILRKLHGVLLKPMKPVWCCPTDDGMLEWTGEYADDLLDAYGAMSTADLNFSPIVLLSCSVNKSVDAHREFHSWAYIQGAGDDEENWAMGLTHRLFWKHKERILCSDDDADVEEAVKLLIQAQGLGETIFGSPDDSKPGASPSGSYRALCHELDLQDGVDAHVFPKFHLEGSNIFLASISSLDKLSATAFFATHRTDCQSRRANGVVTLSQHQFDGIIVLHSTSTVGQWDAKEQNDCLDSVVLPPDIDMSAIDIHNDCGSGNGGSSSSRHVYVRSKHVDEGTERLRVESGMVLAFVVETLKKNKNSSQFRGTWQSDVLPSSLAYYRALLRGSVSLGNEGRPIPVTGFPPSSSSSSSSSPPPSPPYSAFVSVAPLDSENVYDECVSIGAPSPNQAHGPARAPKLLILYADAQAACVVATAIVAAYHKISAILSSEDSSVSAAAASSSSSSLSSSSSSLQSTVGNTTATTTTTTTTSEATATSLFPSRDDTLASTSITHVERSVAGGKTIPPVRATPAAVLSKEQVRTAYAWVTMHAPDLSAPQWLLKELYSYFTPKEGRC